MVLHLRQLSFTPEGWLVVSPERYAGTPSRRFTEADLAGEMVDVEGKFVLASGKWPFLTENYLLMLDLGTEKIENLIIFAGHDWENETETILFTGLDSRGRSVWGKRIE